MNKRNLLYLVEAFQPVNIPDQFSSGMQLKLSPGTAEYWYFGAYSFVESVLEEGILFYCAACGVYASFSHLC